MKILIIITFFPFYMTAQKSYKECHVMQTDAREPSKKHISLIKKYDNKGNLIYEKYQNYREITAHVGYNYENWFYYDSNLLVEKKYTEKSFGPPDLDTVRILMEYENGRLSKESWYKYTAYTKPNLRGCERKYPDDYLPKQWHSRGTAFFKYNTNGLLVEKTDPKIVFDSLSRDIYEYDAEGRLIKQSSYDHGNLFSTEIHEYKDNKVFITRILEFDKLSREWDLDYILRYIKTYDDNGNLIKEECYVDKQKVKNKFYSADLYEYDQYNRLKKFKRIGEDRKVEIIHEYIYK